MPISYRRTAWEQGGQEGMKEATEMQLSRIRLPCTYLKAQSLALPLGSWFSAPDAHPPSQVPGPYLGGFSTVR